MTVIQRIFDLLKRKNITQAQFSKDTKIPLSTITSWKQRNSCPSSDKLHAIAQYLGVSVDYLLGNDESESDNSIDPFNNELVWKAYGHLSEKEKLQVQVYILDLAEKSDHSAAEVRIVEG